MQMQEVLLPAYLSAFFQKNEVKIFSYTKLNELRIR